MEALEADGVDVEDVLHPRCRDSVGSTNSLVEDIERQLSHSDAAPIRRLSSTGGGARRVSSGSFEHLGAAASAP